MTAHLRSPALPGSPRIFEVTEYGSTLTFEIPADSNIPADTKTLPIQTSAYLGDELDGSTVSAAYSWISEHMQGAQQNGGYASIFKVTCGGQGKVCIVMGLPEPEKYAHKFAEKPTPGGLPFWVQKDYMTR